MYLNLLLKRKKEPSHHFSFNSSLAIKTDKEHIHKGFQDHKGLSYSFNGPTKPTTNNQLVYRGFTKNYDGSHFNHTTNDTEYLKHFNLNPTTQPVELYTEYKNKYPKLSADEYKIQTWQTEKGQPNELNRFMRQDKTGRSIEQIEADDRDYSNGLQILEEKIRSGKKDIKEDKFLDADEKKDELAKVKEIERLSKFAAKRYANPVKIKPAIKKNEEYKFEDRLNEGFNRIQPDTDKALATLVNKVKKIYGKKKSSGVEEAKANEPKNAAGKPPSTPKEMTPKQSTEKTPPKEMTQIKLAEKTPKKVTPIKSTGNEDDSDYDSDNTTVNNDTITVAESLKPFYQKAQSILNKPKLKNLPNKTNLEKTTPKLYKELNEALSEITGRDSQIKKLGTLRKKLLVYFK